MTERIENLGGCVEGDGRAEQEARTKDFVREVRAAGGTFPEQIDFGTFIISLASSAMYHLGQSALPNGTTREKRNLAMAHQTIDILAMLQEKTRGNLTREEDQLLCHLLYDLRLRYVRALREDDS